MQIEPTNPETLFWGSESRVDEKLEKSSLIPSNWRAIWQMSGTPRLSCCIRRQPVTSRCRKNLNVLPV